MFPVVVILVVASAWAVQPALAGSIYKCVVHGSVAYSDRPCDEGVSAELSVPAAPQPDPNANRALQQQQAMLAKLEKQRYAREAAAARAQARIERAAAAHDKRCARLRLQQRWANEDLSKAAGENKELLRRKAQRHRQTMALECPG